MKLPPGPAIAGAFAATAVIAAYASTSVGSIYVTGYSLERRP